MKNALVLASIALATSSVALGLSGALWYLRSQSSGNLALSSSQNISFQKPEAPTSPSVIQKILSQLNDRLSGLEASVSALQSTVNQLQNNKNSKIATKLSTTKTSSTPTQTSLFLGSGQTDNRDWITLTSAAADVDLASYLQIKEVRFEAGLGIIGGEAHARLIDLTTGQPIYTSEIYGNIDPGQWVSSPPLNLPAAKHNYAVQLRSSSGEMANLIGARLRIVSK